MSKEEFRNEKLYQTTMYLARKMLEEGIISEEEYRQIDTIFLEKYKPVFGTLFSDISAYNQLVTEKKEIIANAEIIRKTLCVTDALQEEKGKLEEEMAVLVEMTQNIVAENARVAQDQDEYQKRYDGLVQRYDTAKARYDEVVAAISAKEAQSERLADFIKVLKAQDGTISEFDGSLWGSMVEFITVGRDKEITVTFRDGSEILA